MSGNFWTAAGLEAGFNTVCDFLFGELLPGESVSVEFSGEASDFLRFNGAKVRQIGSVSRALAEFRYYRDGRTVSSSVELGGSGSSGGGSGSGSSSGRSEGAVLVSGSAAESGSGQTAGLSREDVRRAAAALGRAREMASLLPPDPFFSPPDSASRSRTVFPGKLPALDSLPARILDPAGPVTASGADFVGLHSQGSVCRGAAASSGARHWYAAENFSTAYSAHLGSGKAVKGLYAGREFDDAEYARRIESDAAKVSAMKLPERVLSPGSYRVYLAPEAVDMLMMFFSWYGLSERELREGESAWIALKEGRRQLSPAFTLTQDFTLGVGPRFDARGDLAPETLCLINEGRLTGSLVSARSAARYGIPSNAAPSDEYLRSPSLAPGNLPEEAVLETLGTGLYLSNLHYLNWSDFDSGRVTGMTRFACLLVENGKIVSPIKDMRFDVSLYDIWGKGLAALTAERRLVVETGSYYFRALEGSLLPGMLVDGFELTL